MGGDRDDLIRQLQAELLSLKATVPQLKLRKTPPSENCIQGDAPFPIHATASIQAPEDASHIDVDTIELQATITTSSSGAATEPQSLDVTLKILNTDLPQLLKDAIEAELNRTRASFSSNTTGGDGDEEKTTAFLHLDVVFKELTVQYSRLLCMLPQCIERYEGVDASGRTIRRVAILNENLEVKFESSVPMAAKKVAPPTRSDGLPRALQAELDSLKLKYTLEMHDSSGSSSCSKEFQIDGETTSLHRLSLENNNNLESKKRGEKPKQQQPLSFSVSMVPTDPEWTPAGCPLHLKCCILDTARFPAAGTFTVVLDQQQLLLLLRSTARDGPALTQQEAAVFNKLLEIEAASVAGRPGALRALLRHCENRVGEMVHQAGDMAVEIERRRRERINVAAAVASSGDKGSAVEDDDEEDSYGGSSRSSHHHDEESGTDSFSSSQEESEEEEKEEEASIGGAPQSQSEGVLVHNSLRLTLESLNLVDIDTLDILKLNLQISCLRCKTSTDASTAQDGGGETSTSSRRHLLWQDECGTCHAYMQLTVAPRIVHDGSNTLAVVRGDGCAPLDMLPSMLAAQCTHCSALAAFRSAQIGKWNERLCGQCHQAMKFFVESVAFSAVCSTNEERSSCSTQNSTTRGGSKSTKSQDADLVVVGQPLPNHGACRHYHHSHRWLRFPCCGRRFPCDLCHEEGTDGHEMMWAQRMVCGFCSTEQAVGERCFSCDKRVATSARRPTGRRTAFWEGGEGQRDVKFLSKRDPHKFSGRKKTKSRKSGRVGTEGKEKTKRAAARTGGMY